MLVPYGKGTDFVRCKGSPWHIIAAVILAVGTAENAFIGKKNLKQGNIASIGREGMADSGSNGITHAMAGSLAVYTAGGTGNIIFGGIRKDGQFFQ